ncbi:glycosyl hydrolase family 61-domain-containing protein [Lophiotrema nucula]|uniref:lytic cellulose monooxygenase (C4-dehydrogenating) n=1 Tax=Lophiotrema nucula TaxID=690887 RepID=A0A6A5ZHF5_9PLEO|nr:glycosyl hydrolase family 61-domain-containing protein [Lophiotrema nucula]
MSFKIQAAALLGALASTASAHGHISGIIADGTYYQGYDPSMQYQSPPPSVVGWSCPECLDNSFVDPTMYTTSDIACHKNATVGGTSASVAAGGKVEFQWTTWPDSHKGPVLTYMAKVDEFASATAADLSFFKIDESGYTDGTWAATTLIANNNSWTVTIPSTLAAGNYVLRHEIIALHSAGQEDGAQNYPGCVNVAVTNAGAAAPSSESATKFYTPTDPGILVNIYSDLTTYDIPGPALWDGASSGDDQGNSSERAAASSAVVVSSTAVVASSAATSIAAVEVTSSAVASMSVVTSTIISTSVSLEQAVQSTSATPITTAAAAATSDALAPIISQVGTITHGIHIRLAS